MSMLFCSGIVLRAEWLCEVAASSPPVWISIFARQWKEMHQFMPGRMFLVPLHALCHDFGKMTALQCWTWKLLFHWQKQTLLVPIWPLCTAEWPFQPSFSLSWALTVPLGMWWYWSLCFRLSLALSTESSVQSMALTSTAMWRSTKR